MIRRTLTPETRVLDDKAGIIEYVASDESMDSDREIVRAKGWRFDRFAKNAPLVDSHKYGSIEAVLGKVIDFRVEGNRLVETAQWAIDVPENVLAQRGYAMTKAGYLRAVSVGFEPLKVATTLARGDWPDDWSGAAIFSTGSPEGKRFWADQMQQLGLTRAESKPATIFIEQQQLELSACVVGANPNALRRSYEAGILTDADVKEISRQDPEFAGRVEKALSQGRGTVYSFGRENTDQHQSTKPMARPIFLEKFLNLSGNQKRDLEQLESARHRGSDREIEQLSGNILRMEPGNRSGNEAQKFLRAHPDLEEFFEEVPRFLAGEGARLTNLRGKAVIPSDALLGGYSVPVSDDLQAFIARYGAWKDLNPVEMENQKEIYASMTGLIQAVWITPTATNRVIPGSDFAANKLTETSNTIAAIILLSREWASDSKILIAPAFLEAMGQALSAAIDYACFQANGTDDQTNGAQTGMFSDTNIANVAATDGNTTVAEFQRGDFIRAIAAVAPRALQRPCRWFINPIFLPALLSLKDGPSGQYLLKGPASTGGEWLLCDWPVTWAAQAPGTDGANQKIAAFVSENAYLVALRQGVLIEAAEGGANFALNTRQIRPSMRGKVETRDAQGISILKTAAV